MWEIIVGDQLRTPLFIGETLEVLGNGLLLLQISHEPVARSGNMRTHLGRCVLHIPGVDRREDTSMLIGNHQRIQKVVHLNLGHAQMRLTHDHVVKSPKSRTPRREN